MLALAALQLWWCSSVVNNTRWKNRAEEERRSKQKLSL